MIFFNLHLFQLNIFIYCTQKNYNAQYAITGCSNSTFLAPILDVFLTFDPVEPLSNLFLDLGYAQITSNSPAVDLC